MTAQFTGGFARPAIESAEVFRAILNAMSKPGSPVDFTSGARPPSPLTSETAAVLLTLIDADVPLWLAADLSRPDIRSWLKFHAGAQLVDEVSQAAFAVVTARSKVQALSALFIGTAEYPDRAATVILQLDGLGNRRTHQLSGPGIESTVDLDLANLPAGIIELMERNRTLYPLGTDLIVTAPGKAIGIPRSTSIRSLEVT